MSSVVCCLVFRLSLFVRCRFGACCLRSFVVRCLLSVVGCSLLAVGCLLVVCWLPCVVNCCCLLCVVR